jgi:hypothetical protein
VKFQKDTLDEVREWRCTIITSASLRNNTVNVESITALSQIGGFTMEKLEQLVERQSKKWLQEVDQANISSDRERISQEVQVSELDLSPSRL